jgi:small subunit ribosomal protein S18
MNRLGKILPKRATRLCAKHQRRLAIEINRARKLALLPYVGEREAMRVRR